MSLAATPLAREQLSPFSASSLTQDYTIQQVPGSPLSPFLLTAGGTRTQRAGVVYSPSSGSPLAQVPDGGSPLLRHLLACESIIYSYGWTLSHHAVYLYNVMLYTGRKRKREDGTPSPSPASKRSSRDSPRVPNSIIVVRRAAPPRSHNKGYPNSRITD